jgi:hypothetical protein
VCNTTEVKWRKVCYGWWRLKFCNNAGKLKLSSEIQLWDWEK